MDANVSLHKSLDQLLHGEIEIVGEFVYGSNYTVLVEVRHGTESLKAVYKPVKGERPLWDFPPASLARREVAAYLTAQALGWALVPPTILRQDAPAGPGSLQLFLEIDPERHYFTFNQQEKQLLRPVVLFDLLINNADRKGGHVLLEGTDRLWLIDHGVCFHHEYKLRTVIWDFVDESIPQHLLEDLERFRQTMNEGSEPCAALAELLSPLEIEALLRRADQLLQSQRFPPPRYGRPYPWPLV